MPASPFEIDLNKPLKLNRVVITITGPKGSGKSSIAQGLLSIFRGQGFQAGLTDATNDPVVAGQRQALNTVIAVEVKDPPENAAPPANPEVEEPQKKLAAAQQELEDLKKSLPAAPSGGIVPGTN